MRRLLVACSFVVLGAIGCATPPAATTSPLAKAGEPKASESTSATTAPTASALPTPSSTASANTTVVSGIARDVKGGAMVVGDDGKSTRIDGLDRWPTALAGKRVVAEGVMEKRSGPSCVNDPLPCQGIVGDYWVLADAKFRLE